MSLFGYSDEIVAHLCSLLEWDLDHPSDIKTYENIGLERSFCFNGAVLAGYDMSPGAPPMDEQKLEHAKRRAMALLMEGASDEDSEEDMDFDATARPVDTEGREQSSLASSSDSEDSEEESTAITNKRDQDPEVPLISI